VGEGINLAPPPDVTEAKETIMDKIKKILAPTDYSELSRAGLHYALDMGRSLSAEVIVLHVVSLSDDWFSRHEELSPVRDLITEQQEFLDNFLREKFADAMNLVEVRQKVELGTAYSNITDLAEREAVDMIIMSTHGRTGLDHILLGSVTEKVIAHAPCPVLAIPAAKQNTTLPRAA
jgi:nucleotide-binding universal stress UspA family protein